MGWVINGWISGDYHMSDGAHMDVEADGEDEAKRSTAFTDRLEECLDAMASGEEIKNPGIYDSG